MDLMGMAVNLLVSGLGRLVGELSPIAYVYPKFLTHNGPPPGSNFAEPDFIPSNIGELKAARLTAIAMVIVLLVYICLEGYMQRRRIRRIKSGRVVLFARIFRQAMLNYAYSFGVLEVVAVIFVGMLQKTNSRMGFLQGAIVCGILLGIICWAFGKIGGVSNDSDENEGEDEDEGEGQE